MLVNSTYSYAFGNDFRVPTSTRLKLIDFGSATFDDQHHTSIVSTRHYRAPEVLLGLGWSFPCDVWSIGCILVELFTGDAIFQTHENHEHLKLMEVTLGPISTSMIRKAGTAQKYFDKDRVLWPGNARKNSTEHVKNQLTLKELMEPRTDQEFLFFELCKQMLNYDPNKRTTARHALKHLFFKERIQ